MVVPAATKLLGTTSRCVSAGSRTRSAALSLPSRFPAVTTTIALVATATVSASSRNTAGPHPAHAA